MNLVEYADREMLMIGLAGRLASDLSTALGHEPRVSFVVPGGTTPGPVFDELAATDLDWSRVDVLLSDERWVAESSPRSNAALVRARLLQGHGASARFHTYYHDNIDGPDAASAPLSDLVAPLLPVNVLLLGMGADMHVASLFPGGDGLARALAPDAPHVLAMRAPGAPEPRLTLSAPVLAGALSSHIVITGADKRAAAERALDIGDPMVAPAAAVLKHATLHWAE